MVDPCEPFVRIQGSYRIIGSLFIYRRLLQPTLTEVLVAELGNSGWGSGTVSRGNELLATLANCTNRDCLSKCYVDACLSEGW